MTSRHLPVIFILGLLLIVGISCVLFFLFSSPAPIGVTMPSPTSTGTSSSVSSCFRAGCYNEVCTDREALYECQPLASHYVCYDKAVCERQKDGECGWTTTKEYDQCLEADYPESFILVPNVDEKKDKIVVTNLVPNQVVPSKLEVEGSARGGWFFEASFPVRLVDDKGHLLARHYAQALGEWMTTDFVSFRTELVFEPPTTTDRGYIILDKDNPSGMPKFADSLVFPIKFR